MKRINNLFEKIICIDNVKQADINAQKGKSKQYGVKLHNKNKELNISELHNSLKLKQYKTSQYDIFTITEPKEREIYRLPYFPDRIMHHAIMNVLEPLFVSTFTSDTYSCIKKRGIHKASYNLRKSLKRKNETIYCLKLDIKKFYPNINHEILKSLLLKKFKDKDLLWLLNEIIDSAPGLPIGNYLSQYLANFYLTYFDHWVKEELKVKYYFRYADDIVILNTSKENLHIILNQIKDYLSIKLKLLVKENWQIFPVEKRGIDFVGYVHYHNHVKLRKSIKKKFAAMIKRNPNKASIASYSGWTKHCNSHNLMKKLLNNVPL
ncbi:reverse transcriptase/maturase family protein [Elizabethkingia miricola]|uniref:reverse transcriptase/maturase family protein n=1 Tax=Elizabethkingia TaxID=308865 RepID=UPI00061BD176|nr:MULTISPECIES: reverse transcriptase/maturase family protein [Elizabethkingia]MCL1653838.1 reverse transcriptase/maturase family protein [Elizabethkingia miricola]QCO45813.1 reverse transcriptase [Elizabethkingia sp. 2-6]WQM37646.1 reverse transcriptase/maturase family protein [Elizabethkingia miricola]CRH24899.1 Group II intron-encoded protein ltrA [Chlamydia trachomatis]